MTPHHMLTAGLVALLALLFGIWTRRTWLVATAKLSASTAFVAAAFWAPTHASYYGSRVGWAVALAWVGDMLLLRTERGFFIAGLVAFFLGHVCYIDAFLHQGFDARHLGLVLMLLFVPTGFVHMWLWPKLEAALKVPVMLYLLVITLMVAASIAAMPHAVAPAMAVLGAALFYASDLCVAREMFVQPSRRNAMLGLPLYYAAQWLLVATLGHLT